ncbi:MAG: RnfH family protein [Pseudomonadota bacterium]
MDALASGTLSVQVALALPERQWVKTLSVSPGTTLQDAIDQSGLDKECPDLDLAILGVGVWGEVESRSQLVKAGDRIELYRPLALDPREARRELAAVGQTMRGESATTD